MSNPPARISLNFMQTTIDGLQDILDTKIDMYPEYFTENARESIENMIVELRSIRKEWYDE